MGLFMNIFAHTFFLVSIITSWSGIFSSPAEANHSYLLPITSRYPEIHRVLATRDIYESNSTSGTYYQTHTLRIKEQLFRRHFGDWSTRNIQKQVPSLPSQNKIQLRRINSNKFQIHLSIWNDPLRYAIEKSFQVHFKEGTYEEYLRGKNFILELLPADQVAFEQMMKTRFILEVSQYLEEKRLKLRSKELYIKSYEFRNFLSNRKTLIMGSADGLVIVHPDYTFELDILLTRLAAQGLHTPIPSVALPQDFSPVEEIDLKN